MLHLESKLEKAFQELKITVPQQQSLKTYLTIVKNHDPETYEHCLRVGLMGIEVAKLLGMNPKAFLYPGLLHDEGKAVINPDILRKKVGYTEEDHEQMMDHPLFGYKLLEGVHDFSAEVVLRHHTYQENPYPAKLPKSKIPFGEKTWELIDKVARIISLLDSYDAFTTRKNEISGVGLSKEETKKAMEKFAPGQKELIDRLYQKGIFGSSSSLDETPL